MLRYILMDTTLFAPGDDSDEARRDLGWMLEALTQRDQAYLKQNPNTPQLYKSGVVYEQPAQFTGDCEEVKILKAALGQEIKNPKVRDTIDTVQAVLGGERFRDIGRILEKGAVDCDNLACWRAAELRQVGIKASPVLTWRSRMWGGGETYHALVLWPNDGLTSSKDLFEDPSLLLGMGGPARTKERADEIRKNAQRCAGLRARNGKVPATLSTTASDPFASFEQVVGGDGGGHHHHGGHGGWSRGGIGPVVWWGGPSVINPWDEELVILDDNTLDVMADFDEMLMERTGSMRGGR